MNVSAGLLTAMIVVVPPAIALQADGWQDQRVSSITGFVNGLEEGA